jgi:hypothetical protein
MNIPVNPPGLRYLSPTKFMAAQDKMRPDGAGRIIGMRRGEILGLCWKDAGLAKAAHRALRSSLLST